jgi:hypothetical protein
VHTFPSSQFRGWPPVQAPFTQRSMTVQALRSSHELPVASVVHDVVLDAGRQTRQVFDGLIALG